MASGIEDCRKRAFGKVMQNFKTPFLRCYAPGDACAGNPIRAHSVQNASILESLQENGHVYVPRLKLGFNSPEMAFGLVGRNLATTFHGLCSEHDTKIFLPIESASIDVHNNEHLFLLAYRAILKETHSTAKSAIDTQAGYKAGVEEGIFPDSPCEPGMLAVEHMMLAHMTHMLKVCFDQIYNKKAYDDLKHYSFDLDIGPTLAVSSLLSTERYCNATDCLAYATINVLPISGSTSVIVSCLKQHDSDVRKSFIRFLRSGNLRENVSYLVLKRCENFVLRPSVFDALDNEKRVECQRFYYRNMGPMSYEPKSRESLNLFNA